MEQYVKIQDLMPGNMIKTYIHGYKPLKYLLSANVLSGNNELDSMYIIKKSLINNLTEDLIVSGGHYLMVDKINPSIIVKNPKRYANIKKIDDKECLLASDSPESSRLIENKFYTIYHLILDGENERYCIYVNGGFLSESTSEKTLKKHINFFKVIR
mgnify:CR=1 FL=1